MATNEVSPTPEKGKCGKRKISTTFVGKLCPPKRRLDTTSNSTPKVTPILNPNYDLSKDRLDICLSSPSTSGRVAPVQVVAVTDRIIVECVPETLNLKRSGNGSMHIPTVKYQKQLTVNVKKSEEHEIACIQAINLEKQGAEGSKIRALSSHGNVIWANHLFENVCLLAANELWTTVTTTGNGFCVYDTISGATYIKVLLSSPATLLTVVGNMVLLILSDLSQRKVVMQYDFENLLEMRNTSIVKVALSNSGIPLVTLSDGEVLYFDLEAQSWVEMETSADSLASLKPYLDIIQKSVPYGVISRLCIPAMERKRYEVSSSWARVANEEQALELLVDALAALNSTEEFEFLYVIYVQRCLASGNLNKLNSLRKRTEIFSRQVGVAARYLQDIIDGLCTEFGCDLQQNTVREPSVEPIEVDNFDFL